MTHVCFTLVPLRASICVQELVPLKQEGPATDFRLSCSLLVRSHAHQQGSCVCSSSNTRSSAQRHRRQGTCLGCAGLCGRYVLCSTVCCRICRNISGCIWCQMPKPSAHLQPGAYCYQYLVDGTWMTSPDAPVGPDDDGHLCNRVSACHAPSPPCSSTLPACCASGRLVGIHVQRQQHLQHITGHGRQNSCGLLCAWPHHASKLLGAANLPGLAAVDIAECGLACR